MVRLSPSSRSRGAPTVARDVGPHRHVEHAQLEQNLDALDAAPLTDEELTAIDEFAIHGTGRR